MIHSKEADGFRTTLEVWHTEGFKIASGVNTPGMLFLFFADEHFLYFIGNAQEEQNPLILVYAYRFDQPSPIATP